MERCCGQAAMVHADHVNSWWGVELLIPLLKHTKYYYFCELSMCRPMPTRGKLLKWIVKNKKGKVEKWSLQVEKSPHLRSSSILIFLLFLVVNQKARLQKNFLAPHQNPRTPLPWAPHQIRRTLPRAPHQIRRTPLERAAHE